MTRRVHLLLAVTLAMLVGCQNEPTSDNNDPAPAQPTTNETDTPEQRGKPQTITNDDPPPKLVTAVETDKIATEVRAIVARAVDAKPESLDATVPLASEKIGVDELTLIDIQESLRTKFDVSVDDDELGDLETLTLEGLTKVVRKLRRRKFGE